jgi:hypothetical protein
MLQKFVCVFPQLLPLLSLESGRNKRWSIPSQLWSKVLVGNFVAPNEPHLERITLSTDPVERNNPPAPYKPNGTTRVVFTRIEFALWVLAHPILRLRAVNERLLQN